MRKKEGKIDIQMFVWSGLERQEAMMGIWLQKYVLFLTERGKKHDLISGFGLLSCKRISYHDTFKAQFPYREFWNRLLLLSVFQHGRPSACRETGVCRKQVHSSTCLTLFSHTRSVTEAERAQWRSWSNVLVTRWLVQLNKTSNYTSRPYWSH